MGVAQKELLDMKGELCSAKGFVTQGSSTKGIVEGTSIKSQNQNSLVFAFEKIRIILNNFFSFGSHPFNNLPQKVKIDPFPSFPRPNHTHSLHIDTTQTNKSPLRYFLIWKK